MNKTMRHTGIVVLLAVIAALTFNSVAAFANLYGVDVSYAQGTINWDTLNASSNFAVMRASYGNAGRDSQLTRNQSEARRLGMRRGYYHFAYPQYYTSLSEANWFVSQVGTVQSGEKLVLDYEQSLGNQVQWCKDFLDRVYALTGVKPLIYLNLSTVNAYDWSIVKNAGYGLWIAYWDGSSNPAVPSNQWGFNTIKQYSSTGSVGGISPVDLDVFNGDNWSAINTATPSACAVTADRMDVVTRGSNNHMFVKTWTTSGGWANPIDIGGISVDLQCIAKRDASTSVLFYRGQNNAIWYRTCTNGSWSGESSVGAIMYSGPAVCCRDATHMDYFYRGGNNQIWTRVWTNGTWSNEWCLGGITYDTPAVVSRDSTHMDLFYRGQDNAVWIRSYANGTWTPSDAKVGGIITSPPSVCSRDATHMDVVYRGQDNGVWLRSWNNGVWSSSDVGLGGNALGRPGICAKDANSMSVFYQNANGHLYQKTWTTAGGWAAWADLGAY